MIIKRFAQALRRQDWFAVFVEILVVIVGLMLAFQLDRWWEDRGDRAQEAQYVDRLIADVEADIEALEFAVELQNIRLEMAELLMAVAADPEEAMRRPVEFLGAVLQSSYLYTPIPTSHTFDDLRSTGNMRLLRDTDFKDLLHDYYGYEANQRQFQEIWFQWQLRHLELAAGVVSHEQETYIQDTWLYFGPDEIEQVRNASMDPDSVRASVGRFLGRQELIDWLPQMRSMQILQIRRNESMLEKAEAVLSELQDYRESIGL
jgi:hypothetical protein